MFAVAAIVMGLTQGAPPDTLTLPLSLARARALRGRVAEAAALVDEARGALGSAGAIPNPSVLVSFTQDAPQRHVIANQPLDWLLRRGADRSAARAGVRRARADSVASLAQLRSDVAAAFYGAMGAQQALENAAAAAVAADSLAAMTRARLEEGDLPQLEADRAVLEALRAHRTLSLAVEAARTAMAALEREVAWTGAPPVLAGALDSGLDAPIDTTGPRVDAVPAVRVAVADSAASHSSYRSAQLSRWPLPELEAGVEWQDPADPQVGALSVIGFAFPLPLWSRAGGEVARARARAAADAARVREARLQAGQGMTQLRVGLVESAQRARTARDQLLPGAQALLERALDAYRLGEGDVQQVLDALRSQRQVASEVVDDLVTFQRAAAAWAALVESAR